MEDIVVYLIYTLFFAFGAIYSYNYGSELITYFFVLMEVLSASIVVIMMCLEMECGKNE